MDNLEHEFDSSWTCNYCGVAEERTKRGEDCPVRIRQRHDELVWNHRTRSHYERTHWVHCSESSGPVLSVIYAPNGNALTHGELCALINELQDENAELRARLTNG